MKTQVYAKSLILAGFTIVLPILVWAQAPTPERPATPGTPSPAGTAPLTQTTPGTTQPVLTPVYTNAEAVTVQLRDPAALFRRLDTDSDGRLTNEEFARIAIVLNSPPPAAQPVTPPTGTPAGTGTDRTKPPTRTNGTSPRK